MDGGSAVGNAVAEGEQAVSKVDVLKFHIRGGGGQLHIGEVPKAPDTQVDEPVGSVLGYRLGDGQDHHIHAVLPDEAVQIAHGVDGHAIDGSADNSGGDIKSGVHGKASVGKGEVLQQGMAQIANADHDQVVVIIYAQNMSDLSSQLLHVIAVALLAEFAEAAEVLTNLRGGDIHFLSQGMGGDADHATVAQIGQLSVISGKSPDDGVRDVLFFQKNSLLFQGFVKIFANIVYRKIVNLSNFLTIFFGKNFYIRGLQNAKILLYYHST